MGRWATTDSRYPGRLLELQSYQLAFHSTEAVPAVYPVRGVRLRATDANVKVQITYLDGDAENVLELTYRRGQGLIELDNLSGVMWRRR